MDSQFRKAFERWYMRTQDNNALFERWIDFDGYEDKDIQTAWLGWQACASFIGDQLSQMTA